GLPLRLTLPLSFRLPFPVLTQVRSSHIVRLRVSSSHFHWYLNFTDPSISPSWRGNSLGRRFLSLVLPSRSRSEKPSRGLGGVTTWGSPLIPTIRAAAVSVSR